MRPLVKLATVAFDVTELSSIELKRNVAEGESWCVLVMKNGETHKVDEDYEEVYKQVAASRAWRKVGGGDE